MELKLNERLALIRVFGKKYRLASKREKCLVLDEFLSLTGFNRSYAARALRNAPANSKMNKSKNVGRTVYYDNDVRRSLEKIWEILDYICSKRLVAILPEIIKKLEYFGEIKLEESIKKKLLKISASTVERLLKPARRKMGRKGSSMTRRGKYRVDQIPIKTFGEWDNSPPGFAQIDLVAHNGGNVYGGFLYTLNATDVRTGWTAGNLVRDKTEFQMLKSMLKMRGSFPFVLQGIHSDNGGEFINKAIIKFAEKYNLNFTRGRPYRKNDCAYIEQKNYSVLRRNTGYLRYDKPEHAGLLQRLYEHLNLYTNYFQPVMMLVEKHRQGAKSIRKYDEPKTPYRRLLERSDIAETVKRKVKKIYRTLNPAELKREINRCQIELIKMSAPIRAPIKKVRVRRPKEIKHTTPHWRRNSTPDNPNPFLERQRIVEMRRAAETVWAHRK